tara:strand:+ start:2121 stop:2579 length:459 start_codon:yes stop_codon:yes gene_type:complete
MPFNTKEKQQAHSKRYAKTPSGMKSIRIQGWKQIGIISNDWDLTYKTYNETTNCNRCNCLLSTDKKRTRNSKCLDHDHSITDRHNIRGVLCHACNLNDKDNNKSGVSGIRWREERKVWTYSKTINKKTHQARFKYFIQAVIYKKEFEENYNI